MLDQAEEPWLPVVAEIAVAERELPSAPRQDADLVAMDVGVDDADVAAAVDHDRRVAGLIGIGFRIDPLERRAAEIDGDVVAAHDDGWSRPAIGLGNHTLRFRDGNAR